jgi:hypothetical protein
MTEEPLNPLKGTSAWLPNSPFRGLGGGDLGVEASIIVISPYLNLFIGTLRGVKCSTLYEVLYLFKSFPYFIYRLQK